MEKLEKKKVIVLQHMDQVSPAVQKLAATMELNWDVRHANSKQQVLEACSEKDIDALVLDCLCRDEVKETLLAEVEELCPQIVCVALDDNFDKKKSYRPVEKIRSVPPNIGENDLMEIVLRTAALQEIFVKKNVQGLAGDLGNLPSVPQTYWELVKVASNPDANMEQVAAVIQKDPAMTARILQLINSAYFGLVRRVTSIFQATTYLGVDMLKGFALNAHVFSAMDKIEVADFSARAFQEYSLKVARLAKEFMRGYEEEEEVFTAGIVHNIGVLVLAIQQPKLFEAVIAESVATGKTTQEVENAMFGATHAEVGAFLLSTWGIPFSIIESAAFHHEPSQSKAKHGSKIVTAIHVADVFVGGYLCQESEDELDMDYIASSGLADRLPAWRDIAKKELKI